MTGRTLFTLSALVALIQAKAIVTNHCPYDVYIWSIPQIGSSLTDNLPIKSGGRYEEPWRYGTDTNPGIAIKISSQPDGIYDGQDEIDFSYSVEQSDNSKIWVDLSPIRGQFFDSLAFFTCDGSYLVSDVPTRQCEATDEIELVLCGTERTTSEEDLAPLSKIQECYGHNSVVYESASDCGHHSEDESSQCTSHCDNESPSSAPNHDEPEHTSESHYQPPNHTSDQHSLPPEPTSEYPHSSSKPTSAHHYQSTKFITVQHSSSPKPSTVLTTPSSTPISTTAQHYSPPKTTMDKPQYSPPRPTLEGYPSIQNQTSTKNYVAPLEPTSIEYNPPPPPPTKVYFSPPEPTSVEYNAPPKPTSKIYPPSSEHTSGRYNAPSKPTSQAYSLPPEPTSAKYNPPPKQTSQRYSPPPNYTSKQYNAPPEPTVHYHHPPSPTTEHGYSPPKHTGKHYASPSQPAGYYTPPPHTPVQYSQPRPTAVYYSPPLPAWEDSYYPRPVYPSHGPYYAAPRPTAETPYYQPPSQYTDGSYLAPPEPVYPMPNHPPYLPPKYTPERPYSSPVDSHYVRPQVTRNPYPAPPQPTKKYRPPIAQPTYQPRDDSSKSSSHKAYCGETPLLNQCSARIVYPWRRAALLRGKNNTIVQVRPRTTIPLSTVLKYEALRHTNATKTIELTVCPSPLCDLVRKYFPDETECDEQAVEAYAREIYPHLCELEYQRALQESDCNKVRAELKKVFPDVDKPLQSPIANVTLKVSLP